MLFPTLQVLFNDIREIAFSPAYRSMCEHNLLIKDETLVPHSYYDAVDGAKETCEDILDLVKRVLDVLQESIDV
jgi:hypothetical protein